MNEPFQLDLLTLALWILTAGASWAGTGAVRRWALHVGMIDHPNARSSHVQPTPRGGGVAFVACYLLALVALVPFGWMTARSAVLMASAGLPVAVVGYLDDKSPLSARWRLMVHALGSGAVLAAMGRLPPLPVFGMQIDLGWLGTALGLIYLVWMTNLYNFMDGIDGIASIQAVTVTLGASACLAAAGQGGDALTVLLLGAAVAGFLVWNFPPARIFMGDAGSGFLGISLGALSLWTARAAPHLFWCWMILMGCFMVDATVTLVRRLCRGESPAQAHRTHAYQHAARRLKAHRPVSLGVAAINGLWLLPWALAVAMKQLDGALATLLAYLPLWLLATRLKAGSP